MTTWGDFERAAPVMAAAGRALLYQFGPGLAFLATVRKDGAPRLHPICPVLVDGGLYAFSIDSPKRGDLLRDGRYALHTFPPQETDDEFSLAGRAAVVWDAARRAAVSTAGRALGVTHEENDLLVEFHIERAFHAAYKGHGIANGLPVHATWP